MSELFLAFRGKNLEISESFDQVVAQGRPWLDRQEVYASIDLWLETHRRRKGTLRFVVGWINRIPKPNVYAGRGPTIDSKEKLCPVCGFWFRPMALKRHACKEGR